MAHTFKTNSFFFAFVGNSIIAAAGFTNEIYGHITRVHVVKYLHSEIKFNGLEALKEQLHQDKVDSLKWL